MQHSNSFISFCSRVAAMHLKQHPKLQKKENYLESSQDSQRGLHVSQQGVLSQRTVWGVRPAVALIGPISNGLGQGTACYPLNVISTNTMQCYSNDNSGSNHLNSNNNHGNSGLQTSRLSESEGDVIHSSATWAQSKTYKTTSCNTPPSLLLSTCTTSSTGSENQEASLRISYEGEDREGPLEIWAVIKPGNTKEKIAIFASPQCRGSLVNGGDGEAGEDLVSSSPVRTVSVKMKSCWEDEGGSVAKRRRRSGSQGHHQDRDRQSSGALETLSPTENSPVEVTLCLRESPRVPECGEVVVRVDGEQVCKVEGEEVSETGTDKALSVVELVAFLEQRASDKQVDSKPVSLRSSTSITLTRGLSLTLEPQQPRVPDQNPQGTDEAECVKVSDMVAKLESECLKHQSVRREGSRSGGELSRNSLTRNNLSRNNSLRRRVGRVLLAGADAFSISAQPPPPQSPTGPHHGLEETTRVPHRHVSPSAGCPSAGCPSAGCPSAGCPSAGCPSAGCPSAGCPSAGCPSAGCPSANTSHMDKLAPSSCREATQLASSTSDSASPSRSMDSGCGASVVREPEESCEAQGLGQQKNNRAVESGKNLHFQLLSEQARSSSTESSSKLQCEEPLPGMLFFSHTLPSQVVLEHTLPHTVNTPTHTSLPQGMESSPKPTRDSAEPSKIQPCDPSITSLLPEPISHSENWAKEEDEAVSEGDESDVSRCETVPFPLRRMVSHEFLEMRFKIQLLLEPQQYMSFLPHHIIIKIFCLLPTESLAALKCTCHYFKFIIESYGVRPADSRWVCDPRYKDDPCKQCKKRYGRGDVSLCRWHHKPYCQALPYGPGYWMCCHGSHKDTPGCNVGLHDNRWVPAFHSISMPIYKKPREVSEE
ncbi:F-box only protein 34-like isoform X2 [Oncorhynchus masou masou]|uniref:F-box only protein 34-like isoform X2 n=1 Tax=Oncorhynchus masou masou TaxID=90313 RepID=UPI00318404E6